MQRMLERMAEFNIKLPKIVVTNIESELIEAKDICFPSSMHLIN